MKLILLLISLSILSYSQIMVVFSAPYNIERTKFKQNFVEYHYQNTFLGNPKKVSHVSYETYITQRSGCKKYKVLGVSNIQHGNMRIMINCLD